MEGIPRRRKWAHINYPISFRDLNTHTLSFLINFDPIKVRKGTADEGGRRNHSHVVFLSQMKLPRPFTEIYLNQL